MELIALVDARDFFQSRTGHSERRPASEELVNA